MNRFARITIALLVAALVVVPSALAQTPADIQAEVDAGYAKVDSNLFGIAVISPPLDDAGNSTRAQQAPADICNAMGGNPHVTQAK
jgi:hypothetical protein